MPYQLREFTCSGCGAVTRRRRPPTWVARCINCAVRASVEAQQQIAARRGPVYDRWVSACAAAAARAQVDRHPPADAEPAGRPG